MGASYSSIAACPSYDPNSEKTRVYVAYERSYSIPGISSLNVAVIDLYGQPNWLNDARNLRSDEETKHKIVFVKPDVKHDVKHDVKPDIKPDVKHNTEQDEKKRCLFSVLKN